MRALVSAVACRTLASLSPGNQIRAWGRPGRDGDSMFRVFLSYTTDELFRRDTACGSAPQAVPPTIPQVHKGKEALKPNPQRPEVYKIVESSATSPRREARRIS